jgi:hypothetical protein
LFFRGLFQNQPGHTIHATPAKQKMIHEHESQPCTERFYISDDEDEETAQLPAHRYSHHDEEEEMSPTRRTCMRRRSEDDVRCDKVTGAVRSQGYNREEMMYRSYRKMSMDACLSQSWTSTPAPEKKRFSVLSKIKSFLKPKRGEATIVDYQARMTCTDMSCIDMF